MTPVLTRHAPEPVRNLRRVAGPAAVAIAIVGVVVLLSALVAAPATINRVTVDNRTDVELDVSVRPSPAAGGLYVTAIDPQSSTAVLDVLDQGDRWIVRAEHAGRRVGTLELRRSDLERAGWRIVLPKSWTGQPLR
jgi:hypothetical protein